MANYSIVSNAKFRPFSYDDYIKPIVALQQQHDVIGEKLSELNTKASIWETLANEQTDHRAYTQYKRYADDLNKAASDLAKYGITAESKPALYSMRSRYASEISPIEQAYQLRAADIARQNASQDKADGRMVFSTNANTRSLDDYLNGMPLQYSQVNLDKVMAEGAAGARALSSRYINTEEGKRFQGDYLTLIKEKGFNPNTKEGQAAITSILLGSGKYPEFEKFIKDSLTKYGATDDNPVFSANDRAAITDSFMQGINMGLVYEREESAPHANWRAQEAVRHANAIQEARASAGDSPTPPFAGLPGGTTDVHFAEGSGEAMKKDMAHHTIRALETLSRMGNKTAQTYLRELKKQKDPEKYLTIHGFNGDRTTEEGKQMYYTLGNFLRQNVTQDENLINIWRSPYREGKDISHTLYGITMGNEPRADWIGQGSVPHSTQNYVAKLQKDWSNFEDLSRNAYKVTATNLRLDPDVWKEYAPQFIESTLKGSPSSNASKLKDIKRLNTDGTVEYKGETKYSNLPTDDKGKIDYSRIHPSVMPNGDLIFNWLDDDQKQVQKGVPLKELPREYQYVQKQFEDGVKSAREYYKNDKKALDNYIENAVATRDAGYLLIQQGVNIKDFELK